MSNIYWLVGSIQSGLAKLYQFASQIKYPLNELTYRAIKIEKGTPGYATVNSNTNIMYISYPFSNIILIVNLTDGSIENKVFANSPGNIVVNLMTDKVYVSSADGIYEFDASKSKCELISAGLPHSDGTIDINQVTNTLYTTCFDSGDIVTIIDAGKRSIVNKIRVLEKSRYSPGYHGTHVFLKLYGIAVDSSTNKVYLTNYEEKLISVYDFEQSEEPVDSIPMKVTNPRFILVNDVSNLLYILSTWFVPYTAFESFSVFDIRNGNKEVGPNKGAGLLPKNAQVPFAFNRISNTLYMKKDHEKSILKLNDSANKILDTTVIESRSFWQRFYEAYDHFAEVIAVNSITNKVYVSDSKNNLLFEIDG